MTGRPVLTCGGLPPDALKRLFRPYGLNVRWCADGAPIPGTYWGEPEAGLQGTHLSVRADTPVHSALHEGSHFLCMDAARRSRLDTDAGGTLVEECAVCYLQILLAGRLPGVTRARIQRDMDAWGYTFRLGSARAWFESDAEDALAFLEERGLADPAGRLVP